MEAGLFYTAAGPFLAAGAFVALTALAFRRPAGGLLAYLAVVYASPYFTYRHDLQAIAAGLGALVLLLAAVIRRPRGRASRPSTSDVLMGVFVVLMVIAAVRGLAAGHARSHLAADVYHYLVVAPALYVAGRRSIRPENVARLLEGVIALSAVAAIGAVAIIGAGPTSELFWMVGAPLDEGGARLKPDFAFPLVPMVVVTAWLLVRPGARWFPSAVLLAAALVLTYKRTYWGAYATGGAVAMLLALTGAWPRPRRAVAGAGATAAAIVLGIGIAVLAGLDTENALRRGEGLTRPTEVSTVATRADELVEVIAHVRAAPLGYGLGAAPEIPFGDPDGTPTHYTHTIYLQWCLQAGIPTAAVGVLLVVVLVVRLVRRRADPAALALAATLCALAVAGLALQSLNSPVSALIVGLAANVASSASARDRRPVRPERPAPRAGGPPGDTTR